MLYPDSDRRMEYARATIDILLDRGYTKTAIEAEVLASILYQSSLPPSLAKEFNKLVQTFGKEFKESLAQGKDYRERVFDQITEIIIGAVDRTYPAFFSSYSQLLPVLSAIANGRRAIGDVADELNQFARSNKKILFFLCCYGYLLMVEGVFDEITRALYYFYRLTNKGAPDVSAISSMSVNEIIREFPITPVFLEKWEEKRHIRNAIAHASTSFNSKNNQVTFVDAPSKFTKTISLNNFLLMVLEFDDIAESFAILLCFINLLELLTVKNLGLTK